MRAAQAVYFGPEQRLFGIHHAPPSRRHNHLILICPPLLDEAVRAHWVLKQMAVRLSDQGFDVFRFNFTGQGNSLGDTRDCDFSTWVADIEAAAQQVRCSVASQAPLSVVATRLAYGLVGRSNLTLDTCCAWDPLSSGTEWHADLCTGKALARRSMPTAKFGEFEFAGYDLAKLRNDLNDATASHPDAQRVCTIDGRQRCTTPYDWSTVSLPLLFLHDVVTATLTCFTDGGCC